MSTILALNAGSSSLKFALYANENGALSLLARGAVSDTDTATPTLTTHLDGTTTEVPVADSSQAAVFDAASEAVAAIAAPTCVVHRLVRGMPGDRGPVIVTSTVLAGLQGVESLAPLHLPAELDYIGIVESQLPGVTQIACFDTDFHHDMPEVAARYALPETLWDQGVRRYGFHGLSYESVLDHLGPNRADKIVIAHLGHGASLAAFHNGQSVDTTMGFTPTGGLVMATRSGDLDPGLLIHLLRTGYTPDRLDELVNRDAGLLGLSGTTSDMRLLLERCDSDAKAALAIDVYCHTARRHLGALTATLDGIDTLVFTGGIGEHAPLIRAAICDGLHHIGLAIDAQANDLNATVISAPASTVEVLVIGADNSACSPNTEPPSSLRRQAPSRRQPRLPHRGLVQPINRRPNKRNRGTRNDQDCCKRIRRYRQASGRRCLSPT